MDGNPTVSLTLSSSQDGDEKDGIQSTNSLSQKRWTHLVVFTTTLGETLIEKSRRNQETIRHNYEY